jgi:hypothetical protein
MLPPEAEIAIETPKLWPNCEMLYRKESPIKRLLAMISATLL